MLSAVPSRVGACAAASKGGRTFAFPWTATCATVRASARRLVNRDQPSRPCSSRWASTGRYGSRVSAPHPTGLPLATRTRWVHAAGFPLRGSHAVLAQDTKGPESGRTRPRMDSASTAALTPTQRLAAELARLGLITAADAAEWQGPTSQRDEDAPTPEDTGQKRPGRHHKVHKKYLESVGMIGLPADIALRRSRELVELGLSERDASTLAVLLPWISDVRLDPMHKEVLKELCDFGIDLFAVLSNQPSTIHIPVMDVRQRLADLQTLGLVRSDVATIVSRYPAVLAFPVNTSAFSLAQELGQSCKPGTPEYRFARRSLWHRQPLRQVDEVDVQQLRRLKHQFNELDVGTDSAARELRGRPKVRGDTSHLLLRENPAVIEAKLAVLQIRPLCLDLKEQAALVRGATEIFAAMSVDVARDRIAFLARVLPSPTALRRVVLNVPAVLLDTGQLEASTAALETAGFGQGDVGVVMSEFRAVRAMLDPQFPIELAARVELLETVLPRERWTQEVLERDAALLWMPFRTLTERLRLLERLGRLDLPITETCRLNTQAFASRLGVRPAYVRFFAKRHAELQRSVREVERVGRPTNAACSRLSAPKISRNLLETIPGPEDINTKLQ